MDSKRQEDDTEEDNQRGEEEEDEEGEEEDDTAEILQMARDLYEEDRFDESEGLFSVVLELHPRCDAALSGRAGCYLMMGQDKLQQAAGDIDHCLAINDQSSDGYCKKGEMLLQQKKPWEAKALFKKAIQLCKDNKEAAVGYRRCLALLDQDFEQARARCSTQPAVQRCLQDQQMQDVLKMMEDEPMAARRVMRESVVVRENLHLLVQSGAIMFR